MTEIQQSDRVSELDAPQTAVSDKDNKGHRESDSSSEAAEIEANREENLSGNSWHQVAELHHRLQRFAQTGIGRQACSVCNSDASSTLVWLLRQDELLVKNPVATAQLSIVERARMTARLLTHQSPTYAWLSSRIASPFDNDNQTVRLEAKLRHQLLDDVREFLDSLTRCLSVELPAVFSGANVELIGSWADGSALIVLDSEAKASEDFLKADGTACSMMDFVFCLPQWRSTNRLCLCGLRPRAQGSNVLAVDRGSTTGAGDAAEMTDFETSVHQACISTIERAVLQRAADLLNGFNHSSLKLLLPPQADAGRDSTDNARPKCVQFKFKWQSARETAEPTMNQKLVTVNLRFGLPVVIKQQPSQEDDMLHQSDTCALHGHLLFGLSRLKLVCLAAEEAHVLNQLDSGLKDGPVKRLVRQLKFVMDLGDWLAKDCGRYG
uniref:Mediator of RNA polymerase II transcription subunit 13 n=1 Tax=Macrostomum lignano TaxID=282301 RepID=A0A1I8IYD4_9PLAT